MSDTTRNGLDAADLTPSQLEAIIREVQSRPLTTPADESFGFEEKASMFLSLRELLDSSEPEEVFLVENLIPSVGLSAIVGIPDGGKSQFTRQLALAIASGDETFLHLRISAQYRRVIVVLTEESKGQVRKSCRRQLPRFTETDTDAIDILPANSLTPDEVIAALTQRLQEAPADLVIIDSFGDMFPGRDPNSTAEMRKALKPLDGIAQRFGVAVLSINHVSKGNYRTAPDQSQVINSSAFVQKHRSVLDLRYETADPLRKFLTIVKGNGVGTAVKQQAMILSFDENTLCFTNTGEKRLASEINASPEDKEKALQIQEAIGRCQNGESVRSIAKEMGVSPSTIGYWTKGVSKTVQPTGHLGQLDSEKLNTAILDENEGCPTVQLSNTPRELDTWTLGQPENGGDDPSPSGGTKVRTV